MDDEESKAASPAPKHEKKSTRTRSKAFESGRELSSTLFEDERPERNWPNCVANAGVQYNFTCVPIALMFLEKAGKWRVEEAWEHEYSTTLSSIAYLGSMAGMCTMGWLGDAIGRTKAMRVTCLITAIFAIISGLAWEKISLLVFRFIVGFGIGGVYPLSAARASEGAPEGATQEDRDSHTGFAFIFQSIGDLMPYLLAMALTASNDWQVQFRVMMVFGAVSPLVVLYGMHLDGPPKKHFSDPNHKPTFVEMVKAGYRDDPETNRKMVATALCWFIFDVLNYGALAFTPTMVGIIFGESGVFGTAWQSLIAVTAGIFGSVLALYHLRLWGPKKLQVWGFVADGVAALLILVTYHPIRKGPDSLKWVLLAEYVILIGCLNWGPHVTTFVLPQRLFFQEHLTTFNGIAAAAGKFGALVGVWVFHEVYKALGVAPLFIFVMALSLLGAVVSKIYIKDDE
mmetsp:Transcript_20753/g.63869  ORF Transcript_20753/g.63869 Transcript_20753/m.63869 type:complete len:456 (-) Transcript_20753:80-1447(-)